MKKFCSVFSVMVVVLLSCQSKVTDNNTPPTVIMMPDVSEQDRIEQPQWSVDHTSSYGTGPRYREEVVKAGILTWNEANDSKPDAAAIIHMRLRSARSHNRTFLEELYYLHGDGRKRARMYASLRSDRATNPRRSDDRSWLGDVTSDLHQPIGWSGTAEEWDVRAERFRSHFDYIEQVLDGHVPDPCHGRPRRWGGSMDTKLIEKWLNRGERIINCGGSLNTFMGD